MVGITASFGWSRSNGPTTRRYMSGRYSFAMLSSNACHIFACARAHGSSG